MKILFLAANPETTSRLNLEREAREIQDALDRHRLGLANSVCSNFSNCARTDFGQMNRMRVNRILVITAVWLDEEELCSYALFETDF